MNIIFRLTCLLLCMALPGAAFAANDTIRFESKAEVEVQQVNDRGERALVREPATLVVPGTIVIYTNSFTNEGTEVAEKLTISNPVPENMEFLAGSVLPATAEVTYSIDGGKTYGVPEQLIVTEANGSKRQAEAREYTNIRWKIKEALAPGETGRAEFRARLR